MSEDLKPIATENTDNVEVQSANVSEVTANEPVGEENVDLNSKGLKELVDFFQELLDGEDVQKLHKYAESIKAAFYKTLRKEKIAAAQKALPFIEEGDIIRKIRQFVERSDAYKNELLSPSQDDLQTIGKMMISVGRH